eukprot:s1589_g1.t1
MLSGIAERIEEQWQISLNTDDLEVRYDENNGLEVFQVTPDQPFWNLRNFLDRYRPEWQTHQFSSRCQVLNETLPWLTFLGLIPLGPSTSGSASSHSDLPLVLPSSSTPPPASTANTEMEYSTTYGTASSPSTAPFVPDNTDDDRAPHFPHSSSEKRMPKHQLTFTVCEWDGGARRDLQVSGNNLETGSFREHQVEFFFVKLVGDWYPAQKMGNYWRQHYGLDTLQIGPVPNPAPSTGTTPGVETLDQATVYAAQLMTVLRSLPPATSPEQHREQLLALVQESDVPNLFTPIDLNTLATQIHQLADLVSAANALAMEVHLTPDDASLL